MCSKAVCANPAIAFGSPRSSSRQRVESTSGPSATIGISPIFSHCRTKSPRRWRLRFFRQAIDLDPTFSGGYGSLAGALGQAADLLTRGLPETLNLAEALARQAIALDGADAGAHAQLGTALYRRGDYEGGRFEAERALAISPNLAGARSVLGQTLIFSGRPEEGVTVLRTSIRLDPRGPGLGTRLMQIALGLYLCRKYEDAVEAAKQAIRSYPNI